MKQYTRLYIKNGVINHVQTQTSPIEKDHVNSDGYIIKNIILDGGDFVRARDIINGIDIDGKIKPTANPVLKSKKLESL